MKKVFFISLDSPAYSSSGMRKGFENLGCEVIEFAWMHYRFNYGIDGARRHLIELATQHSPDIIFCHCHSSEFLTVDLAERLQEVSPTILYTFDVRKDITFYQNIAPHISHTFMGSMEGVWELNACGIDNVSLMQSSADPEIYCPLKIGNGAIEKQIGEPAIVFLGSRYDNTNANFERSVERQQMIEFLYDNYGNKFAAYGTGQRNGFVNPQQEINIYRNAKISICQNNFDLTKYQSDRCWRSLFTGCFTLIKSCDRISEMFSIEEHCNVWTSHDDLKRKIDYYLENDKERIEVAAAGSEWARTTQTWTKRFSEMFEIIEKQKRA